jgi:glycosyltransferase 2 family protein
MGLFVVFLAVVVWGASAVDWRLVGRQLRTADIPFEIAMGAAWLVALCIRPLRMKVLIGAMAPEAKNPYGAIWSADIIAMSMNSVLPMRAGDMMMAFVLRPSIGITTARATSVMLVDRFADFATVVVLFVTMLAMAPTVIPWAHDTTISIGTGLVLLVGGLWVVVHKRQIWLGLLESVLGRAFPRRAQMLLRPAHDLFDGFALIDRLGTLGAVGALSILQWATISCCYWFGINGIAPHVGLTAAAFAASSVALGFIVPIAPGGFGVFHGVVVLAFSIFGVPPEPALAFAIVAHAFQMGSVLALGVITMMWRGISWRTLTNMGDS